jgi:hypothetical protein
MRTALLMLLFLTTASPVLAGPHRGNRRRVGTCSVGLPARSVGPDPMDRASPGVCPSGERGGDRRRCNGIDGGGNASHALRSAAPSSTWGPHRICTRPRRPSSPLLPNLVFSTHRGSPYLPFPSMHSFRLAHWQK